MKFFNIRHIAFSVFISGLLLVTPLLSAHAMTVSPVRLELSGNPGTVVGGTFKLINEEKQAKTLYTVFENFEATGETGSPSFRPGNQGLASWISASDKITVNSGETKIVDFSVTIPKDAEPGGYFAAIFLGTNPPTTNPNQLSIGARIGILLLFRVNGDIQEGGALLDFASKNKGTFYSALPINFYYRFQNSGADRVLPKGSLVIKNIFGQTTRTINANSGEGNVLPKSIRRFELWWSSQDQVDGVPTLEPANQGFFEAAKYQWNNFAFGRYTANLNLSYDSKNEVAAGSFAVFVFPWQLLLIELVCLILVIFILRIGIRKYNRWVIKKARS